MRGRKNEPASDILALAATADGLDFDLACAARAIKLALNHGLSAILSINLSARTLASPEKAVELLGATIAANSLPAERIMFEVAPGTTAPDGPRLRALFAAFRREAIATSIDRFGDRFGDRNSGLDLLADLQPDAVKLSMNLVRKIDVEPVQRAVVTGITQMCKEIGVRVIAVGVETAEECRVLRDAGVHLFQGYRFATPRFEGLPGIPDSVWSRMERRGRFKRRDKDRGAPDRRRSP